MFNFQLLDSSDYWSMADNVPTEEVKEVVVNEAISEEELHFNKADHKYSDHEGLIKKLSLYNRFSNFFYWD